jgi:outer membrane protein TolC
VEAAVLSALQNNRALAVEQLNLPIRRTFEAQEEAAFDTVLGAQASVGSQSASTQSATLNPASADSDTTDIHASASKRFAAGTAARVDAFSAQTDGASAPKRIAEAGISLSVTQPLLNGAGTSANRVRVRQAQLDSALSEYELRGFIEALVATTENAYWELVLQERQTQIYEESMRLAEQQLIETLERIRVGKLADTEQSAAEAEVALRREALINARSAEATARLRLLRMMNISPADTNAAALILRSEPQPPFDMPETEQHVAEARRNRPDLNEARLRIRRQSLEVVRTRNGMLPKLDVFVSLGLGGYSDTVPDSWRQLDGKTYDLAAGLVAEYPFRRREGNAQHQRATLSAEQMRLALANAVELAELDVRTACIDVARAREQVAATAATTRLQREKGRAENEKFRVGRSTALLVAQTQRDLLSSQISEVRALTQRMRTLVELFRLDGSLLRRRGISAPGESAVTMDPPPR